MRFPLFINALSAARMPRWRGRLLGLACLVTTAWSPARAQVDQLMPKVAPPSPNVASLGRYGEYAVNMFTGLPTISIPLYEVKSGSLTLPISLSYHAAGVRCTDQASWVGLGWSLNGGGQISRKVMGSAGDEYGFLARNNVASLDPCFTWSEVDGLARGAIDGEPDVFSYSLLGKGGKFTLNQSGQTDPNGQGVHLVPFAPVQVTVQPGLGQFEITDEDGTYYRFGKDAKGVSYTEFTSSNNGSNPLAATTAWMMTQIAAPNSDDQITFDYQDGGLASFWDYSDRTTVIDLVDDTENKATPNDSPPITNVSYYSTASQQDLHYIYFENGLLEFVLSASLRTDQVKQRSLDHINVYSYQAGSPRLLKVIQFVYSYFKDINNQDLLLKLDEVQFKDQSGAIQQRYGLQYFTNSFSWNANPTLAPGIRDRDYWGYYNYYGHSANTNLIPQQSYANGYQANANSGGTSQTLTIGGADRNTVPQYMKEGVLKRITFPTKGYTEFDFETNQYQNPDNSVAYAGGLRVTKVASYDYSAAVLTTKTYRYGLNESGYGLKNFYPSFSFYYTTQNSSWIGEAGHKTKYRIRNFFSSPTLDLDPYDGSPVVYPYVTEYVGDATTNIGKTVYVYDNGAPAADVARVLPGTGKLYKESAHWKRGNPTSTTVYDKTGKLVSKTLHVYTSYQESQPYRGEMTFTANILSGVGPQNPCATPNAQYSSIQYVAASYAIPTGVYKLTSSMEYRYDQNSADTSKHTRQYTTYLYGNANHLQVTETRQSTSDSGSPEQLVSRMRYPTDFGLVSGTVSGSAQGLQLLQQQHVWSNAVEKYSLRQNANGSNARVLAGTLTTYLRNANNAAQALPDSVYLLETAAPITPATAYAVSTVSGNLISKDSRYQPRIRFYSYDAGGNVTEFGKSGDAAHTVVLWGYNNALPVAEIKNATLGQQPSETAATHSVGLLVTATVSTATVLSPTLVLDHAQTVSVLCQRVTGTGASFSVNLTLLDATGNVKFSKTYPYGTTNLTDQAVAVSLPAGTYTYSFTTSNITGSVSGRFDVNTSYATGSVQQNVFYTSFEDTGVDDAAAKTGRRSFLGNYSFPKPAQNGQYVLSYWQKTGLGGTWGYVEQPVTIPTAASSIAVGNSSAYVDEVRLYPAGAQMVTYTHDPQIGETSVTDPANVTLYHLYDDFQRLQFVKDLNGNIVKHYVYHYKGQ